MRNLLEALRYMGWGLVQMLVFGGFMAYFSWAFFRHG